MLPRQAHPLCAKLGLWATGEPRGHGCCMIASQLMLPGKDFLVRHLLQVASFELTFHQLPLTSHVGQPLPQEDLACRDSVSRTPPPAPHHHQLNLCHVPRKERGVLRGQGQMLRRYYSMEDGVVSSPCSKGIWTSWPSMATPLRVSASQGCCAGQTAAQ